MKKTLRNIVGGLGLLAMVSGCTASGRQFSRDMSYTAVGTFIQEGIKKEMGAYERDRVEVNVNQGMSEEGWEGTAVVKRIENKDGTIFFILDANKVGRKIGLDYADIFLDKSKYNKEIQMNGSSSAIIKYIPIE